MIRWLVIALLLISCPRTACGGQSALFTSTRYVMDMDISADGALWVATRGGVLRRNVDGSWRKFTVADGLPTNEPRKIKAYANPDSVQADFWPASAVWSEGKWTLKPAGSPSLPPTATLPDRPAPPPPAVSGTHLTTRCRGGKREIAALFGEGLYEYIHGKWTRMNVRLPGKARDITALASNGKALWVGTRRDGVWQYDGKAWTQHLQPDEPYSHNIQCIASYRGSVFFSTLEDGLVVRTSDQWRRISAPTISSDAPRQMVEFGGSLYVRDGDGKVDRLAGEKWTLNICAGLPRKQVSAIASDGKRLYVGQWGGWSEFDGMKWTEHLKHSELQGYVVTAILPQQNAIWIGTQGRGLAEVDRATEAIRMHDERNGLSDDWVKCIASAGGMLYTGTFVGGLFARKGATWAQVPGTEGAEITDLSVDTAGNMLIATRQAAYRLGADGNMSRLDARASEVQALCSLAEGDWLGTRTGIWFLAK